MAVSFQYLLFVSLLGVCIVLLLAVVTSGFSPEIKLGLTALALIVDMVAFSTRFYSYIFFPFLRAKNGTIVLNKDEQFIISPLGNSLIVREGSKVYATAFVKIPIYRSATEMSDDEKIDFARLFGRIATISRNPFMLTSQVYAINKDDYINRIREKMNEAEEKYQNITSEKNLQQSTVERIKGEVTMWHNLLDSILRAQSQALVSYITVTAEAGNEEEATTLASQRADEISAGISSILGVTAAIATGPEILLLTQPEYLIPFSAASSQMQQSAAPGGL